MLLTVVGADLEFTVVNMYVLSSLPKQQQSMAGGILQTMTKLSVVVGLGVGTAIFNSISGMTEDPVKPYAATFWLSMAASGLSVCLVPFLKLKTQGHKEKKPDTISKDYKEPISEKILEVAAGSTNGELEEATLPSKSEAKSDRMPDNASKTH